MSPLQILLVVLTVLALVAAAGALFPGTRWSPAASTILLAVVVLIMLVTGACASSDIRTDKPVGVEWWEGPPCRVEVHDGDELVFRARSPHRCVITPGGD